MKVEEARSVKVSKHCYSVLRSFLESSEKSTYPWNTGVKIGSMISFCKAGKWRLNLYVQERYGIVDLVELEDSAGGIVAVLDTHKIIICGNQLTRDTDLLLYYVIPEEPVEFSIPLSFSEIERKIKRYIDATGYPLGFVSNNSVVYAEV
jgi:hypothetical protein